jgi:heat shock protein beta
LIPKYLNFIKGIIDSDDLPINVSRESLQQLKMIKVMGKKVVRKALEMIKKLAEAKDEDEEDEEGSEYEEESAGEESGKEESEKEASEDDEAAAETKKKEAAEKYNAFFKEFGKNIKLGIIEDASNRNRLAELTRWYSTHNKDALTSLDDYIERAKDSQDAIYFIGGENKETLLKNPNIQGLIKRGYEVLLLDDPIDEFCMQHLNEYEKKKLVNVAKGDFKMPTDDESEKKRLKKLKKMYEPLTDWWRNSLKDDLDSVTVSERLVQDPCVVVASSYGYSPYMERIQKAQAYGQANPQTSSKRILEINPHHPVIKELLERVKDNAEDTETQELAHLLYEAALLNSGYTLSDPHAFSTRFFKVFNGALGVPKDAQVEEIQVDIDDVEEEDHHDHDHDHHGHDHDHGHHHHHHGHDEHVQEINPEDIKVEYGNRDDEL